jgi:hypothetical protein
MNDIKKDVFDPEQLLISRLVKKWGVKWLSYIMEIVYLKVIK